MSLRSSLGNFLSDIAWRLLHGKVDALTQGKAEKVQQLLRQEFTRANAVRDGQLKKILEAYSLKTDSEASEAQMNFQPALPAGWQKRVRPGDSYVGFENIFRDSHIVAERNKRYLPFFAKAQNVLDVGCGRGEFLELLQKNGIAATGVDSSSQMIDVCRSKGLTDVSVADAVAYLTSLPKNSQGGIFSCHVIEHLSVDEAIKFFPLAYEALRGGGVLVVETPNPHSLPAFKLFWLDPTHVRPLFPEFLEWAARAGGFTDVQILYLTDDGFSPTHGPWYGNYALVAKR